MKLHVSRSIMLGAAMVWAAASSVSAQDSASAQRASEVLRRYYRAVDGAGLLTKHASLRASGTYEIADAGIAGQFLHVQSRPSSVAVRLHLERLGDVLQVANDSLAWASDPGSGERLLVGRERDQLLDGIGVGAALRPAERIARAFTMASDAAEGECIRVKIGFVSGREEVDCFSTATGLLVTTRTSLQMRTGAIEVVSEFADWKDMAGIMVPTTIKETAAGTVQRTAIAAIEFDNPGDSEILATPTRLKDRAQAVRP